MTLTDQLPAPQGTPKSRARPGPCSINPGMPEVGGVGVGVVLDFPGTYSQEASSKSKPLGQLPLPWLVCFISLQPLYFVRECKFLPLPFTFLLRNWWKRC